MNAAAFWRTLGPDLVVSSPIAAVSPTATCPSANASRRACVLAESLQPRSVGAVRPLPQLSVQQVVPGFLIRFFIRTTLALCCSGISHSATPMSPSSQMLTPRTTRNRAIEETLSIASCSTKPGNRKRQELQLLILESERARHLGSVCMPEGDGACLLQSCSRFSGQRAHVSQ